MFFLFCVGEVCCLFEFFVIGILVECSRLFKKGVVKKRDLGNVGFLDLL